ncbi:MULTISPECIES: DUF3073 domain-containing protein [Corynebacterium]|uniref:DUF3073 domain-containing protein n=1 Tax=Corynebacterium TaxID=1716 RepID=UPI00124CD29F|nr:MULTISPECIES: DUF3073 domain-containing protein [Corynebacterium]MBV7282665.1 DUF3073 domain-containing protein [Corynebacterium sp. TAE3-ERU30]MBV7301987.1 DUF3073 domain-containing protein [Corynebacterium sp. TAE3-ERU2]
MGRGRAKAKQAKVARQLKYQTPEMDLEQLQRELASNSSRSEEDVREDDPYSEWADYFKDEYEK